MAEATCVANIPRMNGGPEGVLPQKILKFEARKCHFLHSEIQVCSKIYANHTCI
jgi:hypothetical protein